MTYTRYQADWKDAEVAKTTPITAAALNHLEDGIESATDTAEAAVEEATTEARDYTNGQIQGLQTQPNPLPQYTLAPGGQLRIWRAGTVPGVGYVAPPTLQSGAQPGDLVVMLG